ncbi:MAG: NADH-quinone oxidoreductase subunit NuoH [Acidimicrobiia bacterium]|nr:NADH-quinone oxidoreductase subunit NuoH [Acidimicrobiia bacterium]
MFGGDPLLAGNVDLAVVLIVLGKVVVVFALLLVATQLMIWFERKVISDFQNRIGPNTAGPFGILQTLADGIKFFFKEDLVPERADRRVFVLAPLLSVVPAFLLFSIVPFGGDFSNGGDGSVELFGHTTYLQLADPAIGILFALAMSSVAVYGVMLAGWSSGSKYPLIGSVRASAQMISYEAALGLSVCAVVLTSGTLSTHGIVMSQAGSGWGFVPDWNLIATGFVPFVVFFLASQAELNRPPFDLVEAEQELVGSYHTEYSSIRFALFFVAEFMNSVTMAALIVTLFLGGPAGPALIGPGWLWGVIWFLVKVLVLLFVFVWIRGTVPRVRYDQLMDLGWKVLIPLSLGWLLLLATFWVARDQGWNGFVTIAIGGAIGLVGYLLLKAAVATSRARRLEGVVD